MPDDLQRQWDETVAEDSVMGHTHAWSDPSPLKSARERSARANASCTTSRVSSELPTTGARPFRKWMYRSRYNRSRRFCRYGHYQYRVTTTKESLCAGAVIASRCVSPSA